MAISKDPLTPLQFKMLADAKVYNHITTPGTPADWYFGSDGRSLIDTKTGRQVPLDPARVPYNGFWNQLLHATPYIGAAFGMGALGAIGGGAAAGGLGVAGVEGGAAGVGGMTATSLGLGTTAGLGTAGGAAATGLGTAAATGAWDAAGNFIGPTTISTSAPMANTYLGMTSGDLTRYGLNTAGNVVNSIIQSRAQGHAFDEQQRLLAEALAYQKEQDAYNRTRQSGLDQQDRDRYGYTTARDDARYGDTQQEYLSEFDRNENRYAYSTDLEASRYADYRNAIAPYLQAGASANDRAASLLGLPAGAPFNPALTPGPTRRATPRPTLSDPGHGFGGGAGPTIDRTGQTFDPDYIGQQIDAVYAAHGVSATGPGSGPTDRAYFIDAIRKNKGWEPYWTQRIADELRQAGVGH